jgi:hypothetical protein
MMARRLGLDGRPPGTLEEAGDLIGVTRERVRQIEAKALRASRQETVPLPALDDALAFLRARTPIPVEAASAQLHEAGLTARPQEMQSVLAVADLLGYDSGMVLLGGILHTPEGVVRDQEINRAVIDTVRPYGLGAVSLLLTALQEEGITPTREELEEFLVRGGAERLCGEWFRLPQANYGGRDALLHLVQGMLAVAAPHPVDLADLHEGVARRCRWRRTQSVPSIEALESYCRAHDDLHVAASGLVSSKVELVESHLLGRSDRVLVEIIRETSDGVISREALQEAAARRGVSDSTAFVYATYSPYLVHLGAGMWSLRGVPVSQEALTKHSPSAGARGREKRLLGFGWTGDRVMAVVMRVPNSVAPVFGIPRALAKDVSHGQWQAQGVDGASAGTIAIDPEGASWGYGPFLRRSGAQRGDILVCEFDVVARVVSLRLGDEEELERFDRDLSFERVTMGDRLSAHELHRRLVEALGARAVAHRPLGEKPLEVDLAPPLPPRTRIYISNATRPPGGRPSGEFKVQLMVPGQQKGERGSFDRSDGRTVLLVGYAVEEEVFILWDAGLYEDFPHSRNVQVQSKAILEAYAGGIGRQQRRLRPPGRGMVVETVVTAGSSRLAEAIEERVVLTRQRLLEES